MKFCCETDFQDSPIGRIPTKWKVVRLKDLCEKVRSGGTPLTINKDYWNGDVPFVKIEDITRSGKHLVETLNFISKEGLADSSAWSVPKHSLLLAMYGSFGEISINEIPVATNQAILGIIPQNKEDVDFLYYWYLYFKPNWKRYVKPTTQANLTAEIVRNSSVPTPSQRERGTIVEILSGVDLAIQKTDEVIAKTDRLKKGLMQQLLIKGIGHREYKDTPIGKIPKTWEVVPLREAATIERGKFAHRPRNEPRFYGGNIPFIQTGDIANANGLIRNYVQTLNEDGLRISKMFEKGTIVISIAGNIGDVGILGFDACFPDSVIGITSHSDVSSLFLMWTLHNRKNEISGKAPRSTQKNINLQILGSLKIPLPSLSEQEKIADILSTINDKLELEKNEKSKLERIKQSLMDLLLTGRIRVKVD